MKNRFWILIVIILFFLTFTYQGMAIELDFEDFNNNIPTEDMNITELNCQMDDLNNKLNELSAKLEETTKELEQLKAKLAENTNKEPIHTSIIVDFTNVSKNSNCSIVHLDNKLEGTGLEGLGGAFVEAENQFNINAIVLCALAIHESASGTSVIARDKNNLFGFGAYNGDPYNNAFYYESKEECIFKVAEFLSKQYLSEGGKYFRGTSIQDINIAYAVNDDGSPNLRWSNGIIRIANRLVDK